MKDPEAKMKEIFELGKEQLPEGLELFDIGKENNANAPERLTKRFRKLKDTTLYYADFRTKNVVNDHDIQYFRKKLNARRLRLYYWFVQPSFTDPGYMHLSIFFYSIY